MRLLLLVLLATDAAAQARVPILLTISTDPIVEVFAVSSEPPHKKVSLGQTPLVRAAGVFVGDKLELRNPELCITDDLPILFGEPNEVKKIERTYGSGTLKILLTPDVGGVEVFCGDYRVGDVSNLPIKISEGQLHLELRGSSVDGRKGFDVKIQRNKVTTVSLSLAKPAAENAPRPGAK